MTMQWFFILFGIAFVLILLFTLGSSVFVFSNAFRILRRAAEQGADGNRKTSEPAPRRAREVVSKQAGEAFKCRNCGATVDSTAELSADGKIRCNYCNSWSSIYQ
ncbi:MAG: hypothetical protein KDA96_08150 [Planctomycetaceae bacterium]|nr:hypothetical protein [Planctomycetaceae bacterium]